MPLPTTSEEVGDSGGLDGCEGSRGWAKSPGQSGSDPLALSTSQSLRTCLDWSGERQRAQLSTGVGSTVEDRENQSEKGSYAARSN